MEPKPVEQNRPPAYPTRREMLAGTASFALLNLTGYGVVSAETEAGTISVAPVFEHGVGRGVAGCVVLTPPVFLSEEEGMQILREELAKDGIHLKAGGILDGVSVKLRFEKHEVVNEGGREKRLKSIVEVPGSSKPLKLDGIDSNKRIAVEFVSEKGYYELGGPVNGVSICDYNFKDTAKYVAALAKRQGRSRVFFGVFYDPSPEMPSPKPSKGDNRAARRAAWKKQMEQGKEEAGKLLRRQARDFVAWLKEQKAIP